MLLSGLHIQSFNFSAVITDYYVGIKSKNSLYIAKYQHAVNNLMKIYVCKIKLDYTACVILP